MATTTPAAMTRTDSGARVQLTLYAYESGQGYVHLGHGPSHSSKVIHGDEHAYATLAAVWDELRRVATEGPEGE